MTHITEARLIGNHAAMGGSPPAAARSSLTVTEILRGGVRRKARRKETAAAQSTWDSEGGASGERELPPLDTEGSAPRGLGR
jgi:hypothetical protein